MYVSMRVNVLIYIEREINRQTSKKAEAVAVALKLVTFGFGLPTVQRQTIGGAINSFLGGFLGQPPQNQNPNQNQGGQPVVIDPINIFDQFTGGIFNPNRACERSNGGCQQDCRVLHGQVNCFCQEGYNLGNDHKSCVDVDECGQTPCQERCINTQGSFHCVCSNGAILLQDGRSCLKQPTETCSVNNGGCSQICNDKPGGGIICSCPNGYLIAPNQKFCVDEDECATGAHNCQGGQTCTNIPGSFHCTSAAADKPSCSVNKGGCQHRCRETKRGIRCRCQKGFVLQSDGKSCKDVDECTTGQHQCLGTCINKPGSFECSTQSGKTGCSVNNGGCEHDCLDTNTGVKCSCRRGFNLQSDDKTCLAPPPELSQQRGCGVNTKNSLTKIVGGRPSNPTDWPWMAALLRANENQQFCGGALITDRHILTAAHCIRSIRSNEEVKVRLGEYNFDTPDENNPTDFRVTDMRMHENYNSNTQENDIAIVKLERPATFSEFISPICLPPLENDFTNQLAYVTGWGTVNFGGPVSTILQEIFIPVWDQGDCVSAYSQSKITETMMCAGLKDGGKDSCQGDSGGPLVLQVFPQTTWHIAGVVSWGIQCARPERPGVYTRVNKYLDWIERNSMF